MNKKTAILSTLMFISASSFATENGVPTTAPGVYDFAAGIIPSDKESDNIGLRVAHYKARKLMDKEGNSIDNDFSLDITSYALVYLKVTDYTLLGGKYAYGGALAFFDEDASVKVPTPTGFTELRGNPFRMADTLLFPLIIQWNPSRNLYANFQLQVLAPTGDYKKDRLVSPGVNHWAFSPIANFTYISDWGQEISSSFQFDISTKNKATNYKNGVEYRHEFAVGQHIGDFTVGLGGYYMRQLSDDDSPTTTNGNRVRTLALGPAVGFFKPGIPPMSVHAYKEIGGRNRPEGYTIAFRIAYTF